MSFLKDNCPLYIIQMYRKVRLYLSLFVGLVRKTASFVINMRFSKYPTIIQLPITYKCNFDCIMCGMRKQISKNGFSLDELEMILRNKLFRKIRAVGINGGEPFLLKDIDEYVKVIIKCLPQLRNIYIISNGYFTDSIVEKSKIIKEICHSSGVTYSLSISIDGYKDMQDIMRGHNNAFDHVVNTCKKILVDYKEYCDSFGTICTVTKVNVDYLAELDTWAKLNRIPISYNIATIHKRIQNEERYEDFSVFTDEHARLMAQEFFYTKFCETNRESYFALYYYLNRGMRIAKCDHKKNVVTLTPDGMLSYCATFSDEIGNAITNDSYSVFFSKKNQKYKEEMQKNHCLKCSHYSGGLTLKNYLLFYAKEKLRTSKIYR